MLFHDKSKNNILLRLDQGIVDIDNKVNKKDIHSWSEWYDVYFVRAKGLVVPQAAETRRIYYGRAIQMSIDPFEPCFTKLVTGI